MNLSDIITKCYILALFIRDDGERLLLGDGFFEFKENLQHFQPNTFVNDVVELQGTDGQLLAGQVRRTAVQTFEGFIADGTIGREQTETNRRRFLQFFRKKHFYTVVYILPDGSAVQRDRGYIVNAPSVPELYQRFPEYSVGLNFEDPNYYEYDEGEDGEEIPAHSVVLSIANLLEGGLIWDAFGAVSNEKTWLDWENGITVDGLYSFNNGLAGAPLEFTQLDGNATQTTYTGKNLFNNNTATISISGATSSTKTATGVRITTNLANTIGARGIIVCPASDYVGKTIYLTCKFKNSNGSARGGLYVGFCDQNGGSIENKASTFETGTAENSANIHFNVSASDASKYIIVVLYSNNGGTIAVDDYCDFTDVQLEVGSATAFEPYVGGVPSPNPDYPQTINTVTGLQAVKITGKNLLAQTETNWSFSTATNKIGTTAGRYAQWGAALPNQTYTMSRKSVGASTYWIAASFDTLPGDNVQAIAFSRPISYDVTDFTFTTPPGTKYVVVFYGSGLSQEGQLELGSQASTYESYQRQTYEINLGGTNLLTYPYHDTPNSPVTRYDVEWTDLGDGTVKANGTSTGASEFYIATSSDYITIKPNTVYTMSGGNTSGGVVLYCDERDASNNVLVTHNNITSLTFTSHASATRLTVALKRYSNSVPINNFICKPQLELGSQATPYARYTTYQYELAKIPNTNYKDAFKVVDGVWYKHAEIGKVVLDGTESWDTLNVNSVFRIRIYDSVGVDNISSVGPVLSDYYTANSYVDCATPNIDYGISLRSTANNGIGIRNKDCADATAFETWLSTHNTIVYYALATPTDTQITEPELLAQLNAIASTFDGVNNITITPAIGAQGELSVHYATGSIDVGAGYEWEEGSDTGTNVIVNNGIDSVFPTWIVPGPATNPTLTNITTGQTIVWEGSVASGETLTVDLNRQTAELGGTNVFAQLSGDWVKLAPGPNKLAYSATGATEGCRLEWNGVVG